MHVNKAEPLKRCPFCGGEAKLIENDTPFATKLGYQVICLECHAAGAEFRNGLTGTGLNQTLVTPAKAAQKAVEAWNHRAESDILEISDDVHDISIFSERAAAVAAWNCRKEPKEIMEISDDLLELSLLSERAAAAADELQQDYFGIRTENVKEHSAELVYRYDRGRVLSNIAADYAYRASKLIEELDEKLTKKGDRQA